MYTEEQMKKIAVESFNVGVKIGEKRAAAKIEAFRSSDPDALILSPISSTTVDEINSATRTRVHLTVLPGGAG